MGSVVIVKHFLLTLIALKCKPKFAPHQDLNPSEYTANHFHSIPNGAKNGEKFGLKLILDAETFDYAYYLRPNKGLKLSLSDARDKAVVNQDGYYLKPGWLVSTLGTENEANSVTQLIRNCIRGLFRIGKMNLDISLMTFHFLNSFSYLRGLFFEH